MQGSFTDMTERFARKEKLPGKQTLKKQDRAFRQKRRNRHEE